MSDISLLFVIVEADRLYFLKKHSVVFHRTYKSLFIQRRLVSKLMHAKHVVTIFSEYYALGIVNASMHWKQKSYVCFCLSSCLAFKSLVHLAGGLDASRVALEIQTFFIRSREINSRTKLQMLSSRFKIREKGHFADHCDSLKCLPLSS